MSNYESTPSPRSISDEQRKIIYKFFGDSEHVGTGSSCPRCGASIEWNYINGDDMILHIKWHENLQAISGHQSKPYPGLEM